MYTTVDIAQDKYPVSAVQIETLIKDRKIRYVDSEFGILVNEDDLKRMTESVDRSRFDHLEGQEIHISAAARKYDIPHQNISRWIKANLIQVIGHNKNRVMINEADVAYIKAVIDTFNVSQGQALADYIQN